MRLTKGLVGQFGRGRVRDTPISEAGFIGAGVGAAASGLRPVVDLMYVGFYGVCADQITNNAAKMHYMFGGKVTLPLIHTMANGHGSQSAVVRRAIDSRSAVDFHNVAHAVHKSGGLAYTKNRAFEEAYLASEAVLALPPSRYRDALEALAMVAVSRMA